MKRKSMCGRVLGIVLVLLVLSGIVLSACFMSFLKPGVHVLGRWVHVDLQKTCYFITHDNINGIQVTGESTFTAMGYVRDPIGTEAGSFRGHMNVETYPISLEQAYLHNAGGIGAEFLELSCMGPDCEISYWVRILKSDPDVIVIHITRDDGQNLTAVCGDTEEQAIHNYQRYLEAG